MPTRKKYTSFWDFGGSVEDKALIVMIELAALPGHLSSFSQSVVILRLFSSNRNLFFILTEEDHPSHLCRKAANGMYEAFVQHLSAATWAPTVCTAEALHVVPAHLWSELLHLLPRTLTRGGGSVGGAFACSKKFLSANLQRAAPACFYSINLSPARMD